MSVCVIVCGTKSHQGTDSVSVPARWVPHTDCNTTSKSIQQSVTETRDRRGVDGPWPLGGRDVSYERFHTIHGPRSVFSTFYSTPCAFSSIHSKPQNEKYVT